MGRCPSCLHFTSYRYRRILEVIILRVLAHYFITHSQSSVEELTKIFTDFVARPDIDPDRKAKLSVIILELANPDSELVKYINRQIQRTDTPFNNMSLCISSLEDAYKYQLRLSLLEDKLKSIQSLNAINLSSIGIKPPREKLPRPPKVIKLHGGKK